MDPGFFYETVAPLMIVGTTTLIGISTLTSEINFYTRLIRLKDKATGLALFTVLQVELACAKCKDEGKATDCVHLLHLVPRWQSSERHRRLKTVMQDRPDLIESELSGLAFDSLQQCFRAIDLDAMFALEPPLPQLNEEIFVCVDPAGGGPQSDFSFVSFQRIKGQIIIVGMDTIATKEPTRQYKLLEEHINALRKNLYRSSSKVTIYVERNLAFEVRSTPFGKNFIHLFQLLARVDNTVHQYVTHFHELERLHILSEFRQIWHFSIVRYVSVIRFNVSLFSDPFQPQTDKHPCSITRSQFTFDRLHDFLCIRLFFCAQSHLLQRRQARFYI